MPRNGRRFDWDWTWEPAALPLLKLIHRGKVACLAKHGVTHVFNSWDAMPLVSEQLALAGSVTNPRLLASRFLLKPGSKYEEAVKTFQPYNETKEINEEARKAIAQLIKLALAATG